MLRVCLIMGRIGACEPTTKLHARETKTACNSLELCRRRSARSETCSARAAADKARRHSGATRRDRACVCVCYFLITKTCVHLRCCVFWTCTYDANATRQQAARNCYGLDSLEHAMYIITCILYTFCLHLRNAIVWLLLGSAYVVKLCYQRLAY